MTTKWISARGHRPSLRGAKSAHRIVLLAAILVFQAFQDAKAILVYGDQGRNLTAPTDPGQNLAWQFEGVWQGNYLSTPIAPNYFITAAHLGGQVGDPFVYQGTTYTTTAEYTDPNSPDLRIWQVSGTFGSYAPLYDTGSELNQPLIVFGEGGARGPSYSYQGTDRGWLFLLTDPAKSWGTNQVDFAGAIPDSTPTQYLAFQFNSTRGPNTASLSPGDSGGGVFIEQDGVWKLAGVNFAVDGPYYTVPPGDPNRNGSLRTGAIYDQRGLYVGDSLTPVPDGPVQVPAYSYASRVSSEFGWIYSITGVPEPSGFALVLSGLAVAWPMIGRRRGDDAKANS